MYIGFIQLKSVDFDCMYAVRIHFFALLFGMQLLIIFLALFAAFMVQLFTMLSVE